MTIIYVLKSITKIPKMKGKFKQGKSIKSEKIKHYQSTEQIIDQFFVLYTADNRENIPVLCCHRYFCPPDLRF